MVTAMTVCFVYACGHAEKCVGDVVLWTATILVMVINMEIKSSCRIPSSYRRKWAVDSHYINIKPYHAGLLYIANYL